MNVDPKAAAIMATTAALQRLLKTCDFIEGSLAAAGEVLAHIRAQVAEIAATNLAIEARAARHPMRMN